VDAKTDKTEPFASPSRHKQLKHYPGERKIS